MLAFFRRAMSSWVVIALLGLIILAFAATGIQTGNFTSGGSETAFATVGGRDLEAEQIRRTAQQQVDQAKQQNPGASMADFVAQGGFTMLVDQQIKGFAVERWAEKQGYVAGKRLIDGEIASLPAFQGADGKFDPAAMQRLLTEQHVTDAQLRKDFASDLIRRQVLIPITTGVAVAPGLARPYAALLLEKRTGLIAAVPTATMIEGAAPAEAAVAAAYKRDLARYTLPERRSMRYALLGPETVAAAAAPSDAEIATDYKANAADYAPSEKRVLQQVILQDPAAARALAAKVRAGTPFAVAAQAQGFAVGDIAVAANSQPAFAKLTNAAVAGAAFAAAPGSVTDPVKSDLGWHVVHIVSASKVPGRTLDQARADIAKALTARKSEKLLGDLVNRIEDALSGGATFDEAIAKEKLTAIVTPPLLPAGIAPDARDFVLPPAVAPLLKAVFGASPGDQPTVEALPGPAKSYALLALGRIVPPAPLPLAAVRDSVVADIRLAAAYDKASAITKQIVARASAGMPLAQAVAAAGLGLKPPAPVTARRIDLQRAGQAAPALQKMFLLAKGKTELLPLPNRQGYYIVQVSQIEPGDVTPVPQIASQIGADLERSMADELAQQFATAAADAVGVVRHDAVIAKTRAELGRTAAP